MGRFGFLLLFSLLFSSTQVAAETRDFDRRGFYAGVNGVYGISLFQDDINEIIGYSETVRLGDSGGVNGRLGYRILSWLAIEAEYEWIKSMDLDLGQFDVGDFKPHTFTGNLKIVLPTGRWQPYLLAGAGAAIWDIDGEVQSQSSTGFAGRAGLGLDIYLTESLVFNLEGAGVLTTNDIDPSEVSVTLESISHLYYFSFSAGLMYRF